IQKSMDAIEDFFEQKGLSRLFDDYIAQRHHVRVLQHHSEIPSAAAYHRTAGEVEARNAQRRSKMPLEERLRTLLSATEDVAEGDKIYLEKAVAGIAELAKANARDIAKLSKIADTLNIPADHPFRKLLDPNGVISNGKRSFIAGRGRRHAFGQHIIELGYARSGGMTVQEAADNLLPTLSGLRTFDKVGKRAVYTYTPEGSKIEYTIITGEGKDGNHYLVSYYSSRNEKQTKKMVENYQKSSYNRNATAHFQPMESNLQDSPADVKPGTEKNPDFSETGRTDVELADAIRQKFSSGNTSLREVAAGFRKINFQPGTVNLDLGGGRFDEGTKYLAEQGVKNLVFDPVNRDSSHNREIFDAVKNGGVDTVTCNNVLNVIREQAARSNVILQAAKALKPGGTAYFTVYEGDGSGRGRQSQADAWQEHRKTADYLDEIRKHFEDVSIRGKVIIARGPITEGKTSAWAMDSTFENPLQLSPPTMEAEEAASDELFESEKDGVMNRIWDMAKIWNTGITIVALFPDHFAVFRRDPDDLDQKGFPRPFQLFFILVLDIVFPTVQQLVQFTRLKRRLSAGSVRVSSLAFRREKERRSAVQIRGFSV
ncbi:MAG: methyltransferase domain-containing protein, partial [Lentisphaeria bacterium]|nr:methyltransferase domain-containing protein [Lentisphaeria bacterium]